MKDFLRIIRRFVPPYKKYMVLNIVFNILSAILNLFSFALIIPILNILFKLNDDVYSYKDWVFDPWTWESWKGTPELIKNNFFWFVSDMIEKDGGIVYFDYLRCFSDGCYLPEGSNHVFSLLHYDTYPYGSCKGYTQPNQ